VDGVWWVTRGGKPSRITNTSNLYWAPRASRCVVHLEGGHQRGLSQSWTGRNSKKPSWRCHGGCRKGRDIRQEVVVAG